MANSKHTGQRLRSTQRASNTTPSGTLKTSTKIGSPSRLDLITPSKHDSGWRRVVRNFSPSWFSVTMGTGIVSLIFITIPWKAAWLHYMGIVFFVLNALFFSLALLMSAARYVIWPEIWSVMVQDVNNSLFLGTIPMGFATLIEMWIFVCVPAWGHWAVWVAFGAWVLDCVVAVAVTTGLAVLL
jgi:tellurite resistance protein TehA-like permease